MKKIIFMVVAIMLTFGLFAQEKKTAAQIDAEDAIEYMKDNNIEFYMDLKGAVKKLPEGAQLLTIDFVDEFIQSATQTRTVTMEAYAYADFSNPTGQRLELAGGVDSSSYDGYQYKFERYSPYTMQWINFTKDRMCPGGSSSSSVDYCTQNDETETTFFGDYNEYTACGDCDDNYLGRIRAAANLFTVSYHSYYIPGVGWVYLPTYTYAGWQYAWTDGTPPPYSPSSDLCDTPVMLVALCPYL